MYKIFFFYFQKVKYKSDQIFKFYLKINLGQLYDFEYGVKGIRKHEINH